MASKLNKNLIKKKFQTKEESTIAQRFIELKLEEMEFSLASKKKEQELAERREIRQVQLEKIQEARKIIELLSSDSFEKNATINSILKDCYNILSHIVELGVDDIKNYDLDNKEELVHLTAKDLKHALEKTNVLEIMESAKKNGWDIRIINGQLILYRNGKRFIGDKSFVPCGKIEN